MINSLLLGMWIWGVPPKQVQATKPIKFIQSKISKPFPIDMVGKATGNHIRKPVIYDPYNLTVTSNLDSCQVEKILRGTGLQGLEDSFLLAEQQYHVNAYFLMGLAIQESGWGTSYFARERNNLTGYCAYTESPNDAMTFSSKTENLLATAKHINKEYLSVNGDYYRGTSIWDVNANYSIEGWAEAINNIIKQIREE